MVAEPGWCGVCGLPVPAGERFCRWPFGAGAGAGQPEDEVAPGASHSLAFLTELAELQHWRCPWCADCLPDSPRGTAIDHIIPRVYGGPHRRWNLQLLHSECNSAKGKKITAGALELADAHGVRISMDIGHYHAGVRRRAAIYAVRATRQLGGEARGRALAAARTLTVFFPEAKVRALIRAAAQGGQPAAAPDGSGVQQAVTGQAGWVAAQAKDEVRLGCQGRNAVAGLSGELQDVEHDGRGFPGCWRWSGRLAGAAGLA